MALCYVIFKRMERYGMELHVVVAPVSNLHSSALWDLELMIFSWSITLARPECMAISQITE